MATIKKYNGSTWENTIARKYETKSEIIVPPTTIYADGSNITTYTIKGNTVQNGTPTPTNPIAVNGVGELVGSDYQIPISSGGVTTNIYLGSTQTVRQIKKYVFDGTENFANQRQTATSGLYCFPILYSEINMTDIINYDAYIAEIDYPEYKCSHFAEKPTPTTPDEFYDISDGQIGANSVANYGRNRYLIFCKSGITTTADFKTWLAAQYANGTPVAVYYILATAETATINEPLQKIGTYADTLSNATAIPTTEGANSITVDATVQPSDFTATWTGWHDSSVKEWDGSDWS